MLLLTHSPTTLYLIIVRDVQSGVVGDDVVVDGEDGLGVRLDPRHLDIM